jgi:hypothetical protein
MNDTQHTQFLDWTITVFQASEDSANRAWCAQHGELTRCGANPGGAMAALKDALIWGQPTLPVLHMNGSGGLLHRGADALSAALDLFHESLYSANLPIRESGNLESLHRAISEYLQAHLAHYDAPTPEVHPEGVTHKVLDRVKCSIESAKFSEKVNSPAVRALMKAFRNLEDAFLEWEFNRRDYYPIDGLFEAAQKERQALARAIGTAMEKFSLSRTLRVPQSEVSE